MNKTTIDGLYTRTQGNPYNRFERRMTNRRSLEIDNSRNKSYGFYIGGKTIDNQARKISDTFNNPETYTQIRNQAVADFAKSVANESKEYSQSREDGKKKVCKKENQY